MASIQLISVSKPLSRWWAQELKLTVALCKQGWIYTRTVLQCKSTWFTCIQMMESKIMKEPYTCTCTSLFTYNFNYSDLLSHLCTEFDLSKPMEIWGWHGRLTGEIALGVAGIVAVLTLEGLVARVAHLVWLELMLIPICQATLVTHPGAHTLMNLGLVLHTCPARYVFYFVRNLWIVCL